MSPRRDRFPPLRILLPAAWLSLIVATAAPGQNPGVFLSAAPAGGAQAPKAGSAARQNQQKFMPDQVLVRFRQGVPGAATAAAHRKLGAHVLRTYSRIEGLHLVRIPPAMTVEDALHRYKKNPDVLYAEPDYHVQAVVTPDDPSLGELWGLHNTGQSGGTPDADIDAPEAWDYSTGDSAVVVAVIDSGVDYTHPDLAANIWSNPLDCDADGVDDDGNGYIDDCHGIDVFNNDSNPWDDRGHGTHVSGTIGAVGNNAAGVVGVNWHVSILACKFLNSAGEGSISGAVACLDYVALMKDQGVSIVASNNSWGGGGYSQALYDAIAAQRQRGILFFAAAGNGGGDGVGDENDRWSEYPPNYYSPNLVAVAASTRTDGRASFSNYGRRSVHLGAPGEAILSTWPQDKYPYDYHTTNGTSMATPHATGVAALLKAYNPSLDWKAIKNLILAGGDDNAALAETITQKRLNAHGALTCSDSTILSRLQPRTSSALGAVGEPVDLAALHINCASPNGEVQVSTNPGGETLSLLDDGVAPDQVAGDGIYSGQFTPDQPGPHVLTFPGADEVTVQVLRNYKVSEATYDYRNIAGTNLQLESYTKELISPPFPIPFGSGSFAEMWVDANGIIYFDEKWQGSSPTINDHIPTSDFATLVAPFWDNLKPFGTGSDNNVFWDVIGTEPNRELVIEWKNVRSTAQPCDPGTVRFQIVFFENSSDMLFNYADTFFGGGCYSWFEYGGSASVGIQVSSTVGTEYSFNEPSLSDGLALRWTLASLTFSPASLDFGGVLVGTTSAPQTITLTNNGNQAVTISDIAASGDFAETSTCGSSLPASASCTIDVTFTPAAAGTRTGELTVNSDAPGSPHTVSLSGSGTVPAVTLSPTGLSFGNQALGTTSAPKTVKLTNTGTAPLVITSIGTSGNYAQTNDCDSPLAPAAFCTISVTFSPPPTVAGGQAGTLSVVDNAAGSPHTAPLSGVGVGPVVVLSATSLNFGNQPVGTTSAAKLVNLSNTGNAPLTITSITPSGDFAQTNNCPGSLAARSYCTLSVTFTPTTSGARTGDISIVHDAAGSPHTVSLSGNGTLPAVTLSPTGLSFGNQALGTTSAPKPVKLTNSGLAPLTITSISTSGNYAQTNNCSNPLAAGAYCTIQATFTPQVVGGQSGTLTIVDNASGSPHTAPLSGVGVGPVVVLSTTSLNFGNQPVGTTSAPRLVNLSNTGNAPLSITSITPSGDFAQTNNCASPLAARSYCTLSVTFAPTTSGVRTGDITIVDSAVGSPHTVNLSGNGTLPAVTLSPTGLSFGNQALGTTSAAKPVKLTNSGLAPLTITSISTSGNYAQTNNCSSPLAAAAYCTIQVTFTPTVVGGQSGTLTIVDNASGSPHTAPLSGIGVGPVVVLSTTSLNFGNQPVGATSAPRLVNLSNTGNAPLTITSITPSGDFAQTNNCPGSLAARSYCTISVTFTPTTSGVRAGAITIVDNAAGSPHTVSLSGNGTLPAVTLSPTGLSFGNQALGTTSTAKPVKLTNSGLAPLTITSISTSGNYGQTNNCSSPLAAAAYCTIQVTFTPAVVGGQSGTLTIVDNASGSPHTAPLSGVGVGPVVVLSTTNLNFGNQPVGTTSAPRLVNLSNTGNAPLTITGITPSGDFAQTNNCSSPLAARSYCTLSVTFTPTTSGTRTGDITIVDSAAGSPHVVSLTGTGTSP